MKDKAAHFVTGSFTLDTALLELVALSFVVKIPPVRARLHCAPDKFLKRISVDEYMIEGEKVTNEENYDGVNSCCGRNHGKAGNA